MSFNILTAICIFACLCLPRLGAAASYTTIASQGVGQAWPDAIWQDNGTGPLVGPPAFGNDYECVSNGVAFGFGTANTRIRNPINVAAGTVITFAGDSLKLDANTEIRLKNGAGGPPELRFPGIGGNPGLILDGGVINPGDDGIFKISGTIQVASQSYISGGDSGGGKMIGSRAVNFSGQLTGDGNIVIYSCTTNYPQVISGLANSFSGQWFLKSGWLFGSSANSLGTNSITVDPSYVVANVSSQAGPAVLEVGYDLVSSGTLKLVNGGKMDLHQNCTFNQIYIEQTPLSAGTHSYSELAAAFPGTFLPGGSGSLTAGVSAPPPPPPKTYYVNAAAGNASDNNTGATTNSPWKTIQHAANTLQPGDTVYIMAGVYRETVAVTTSGNAAAGYITYSAYPGQEQQAVIDQNEFRIRQASYVAVHGLRIQNSPGAGISVDGPGANYIITGNYTSNTVGSGISVWGTSYGHSPPGGIYDPSTYGYKAVTNVLIADNTIDFACNTGFNECLDIANGVDSFEIRSNIVKNATNAINGGEGIDCKEGASNGKIWGNQLFNNSRYAIYLDAGASVTSYYATPGVLRNIVVYNNLIHNNGNHGIGITSEGRGCLDGIGVYNNICYSNNSDGILLYDYGLSNSENYCRNILIINNTVYRNDVVNTQYGGIELNHAYASNVVVRNNIAYKNVYQIWNKTANTNITIDYNVLGDNKSTGPVGSHNLPNRDPQFVNEAAADFHLASTSPAIGYASSNSAPLFDFDEAVRPRGTNWDCGANEYSPAQASLAIALDKTTLKPIIKLQHGTMGAHYQIQWRSAANQGTWNLLQDVPSLSSLPMVIMDSTQSDTVTQRFYRAIAP